MNATGTGVRAGGSVNAKLRVRHPLAGAGRQRTVKGVNTLTAAGHLRAGRQTTSRPGAFSLIELVVVAALSSIFLLMLVNWVFTLNSATSVLPIRETSSMRARHSSSRSSASIPSAIALDSV